MSDRHSSFPALRDMGDRIVVLGPSNAGKSTLAAALGRKLEVGVVHLDQLRFLPNTDWRERPDADFSSLHETAIAQDKWVIEGNYSAILPPRLARATGIILIRPNRLLRLYRYVRRTLRADENRIGHLDGGTERIKLEMIDWVLLKSPSRARHYAKRIRKAGKPFVDCTNAGQIADLYDHWGITRFADESPRS